MGSAKLGLLRTLIGDVPCGTDEMLDAMEEEHKRSSTAKIAFRGSAGEFTTAYEEWDNTMKDHSSHPANDNPDEDLKAAEYTFATADTHSCLTSYIQPLKSVLPPGKI